MFSFIIAEMLNMATSSTGSEKSSCGSMDDQILRRSVDLSFGTLTALLNLAEIIILLKMKRQKKVYEIVLLGLSISDFMFGLSNGIVFMVNALWKCRFKETVEGVYTLYVFFVMTSILHSLLIALERFLAVLIPMKYKIFSTRKKTYISVAILWILAIILSALVKIINEFTYKFQEKIKVEQTQS